MARQKKRKDERYEHKIKIGYKSDGKVNRVSVYGRTQPELDENVTKVKSRMLQGLSPFETKFTLNDWIAKWELVHPETGSYENRNRRRNILNHIKNSIGFIPITEIKLSDIQVFYNTLSDYTDTCKRIKNTLFNILESAVDDDILLKNPAKNAKINPKKSAKVQALKLDEEEILLNCGLDLKELCYCGFSLYAGLRPGEARAFTIKEAEEMIKTGLIDVRKAVAKDARTGETKIKDSPKTTAGFRTIPMKDELKKILSEYMKSDLCNNDFLLLTHNNKIISHDAHQTIWDRIKRKYKATYKENHKTFGEINIIYYQLRHTFITRMWYDGIDIKTAQYLAGHEDAKLTLDIYTSLEEEKARNERIKDKWKVKQS